MTKPTNPQKFFREDCQFTIGAAHSNQIVESNLPEIAFIGRSNVGKSSIINALLNKKIAHTSKTPGRTKQLNFFCLNNKLNIVDMPGYGFAKAGKQEVESWQKLSYQYFANRPNLKKVFLLLDSRRGLDKKDTELMNIFNALATSYQIILTKIDQLKREEQQKIITQITEQTKNFAAQHPTIIVTSSTKNIGITDLQKAIIEVM